MRNLLFVTAIAVLGIWSCALKDVMPPGPSDDPVFIGDFSINGASFTPQAGVDGIYMFAKEQQGPDNVWQLSGSFAAANCPSADCPGTVTFTWRNNLAGNDLSAIWTTGPSPLFRADLPGSNLFRTHLTLISDSLNSPAVAWTVNDTLAAAGNILYYDNDGAPLRITTQQDLAGQYQSRTEQLFLPGESRFCLQNRVRIRVDTPKTTLTAMPLPNPAGPFLYAWSTGETTAEINFIPEPDKMYTVTVTQAGSGCSAVTTVYNVSPQFKDVLVGNIQGDTRATTGNLLGGAVIEWIDPQGGHWRSDRKAQQFPANQFTITEISDYLENESGLPTKMLKVSWICQLYNESGEAIPTSGAAVIAVGWPQ